MNCYESLHSSQVRNQFITSIIPMILKFGGKEVQFWWENSKYCLLKITLINITFIFLIVKSNLCSYRTELPHWDLWAKSGLLFVFINKVLLEHSNAHSFSSCFWLIFFLFWFLQLLSLCSEKLPSFREEINILLHFLFFYANFLISYIYFWYRVLHWITSFHFSNCPLPTQFIK